MLTLPAKPWKKVKIVKGEENRYTIYVLSRLKSESQFQKIIRNDLKPCLGKEGKLTNPQWKTRSITLITPDFISFQKKLIFQSVMVEKEGF